MKKIFALLTVLASLSAFANEVVWVRGNSESEVTSKMKEMVQRINSGRYVPTGCSSRAKVYAASAPKLSYRTNRHGELQKRWTATIKVACSDR